ncbi:hypothetical protein [Embleya sp. AB8]|uniref:hypothetical protein n=1 Tax=Embleya sp. AB8 TaxID=3156304 RepID=UPI003C76B43F
MADNRLLAEAMGEYGLDQAELADVLNNAMVGFTGRVGTLSDRHVRRWLSGQSTWPQERQRRALETVFERSARSLGFIPRTASPPEDSENSEDQVPVHRRTFVAGSAAVTADYAAGRTVKTLGMSDVARLRTRLDALADEDNRRGSGSSLECRAVAMAKYTLDLQRAGSATQRVRGHLYAVASEFATWALWAAIDERQPERAQAHMDRGVTLAGMSGDSAIMWRAWNQGSMASVQLGHHPEALAAAEAARGCTITRRDQLRASLTHARVAGVYARIGERNAALRALGHAWAALERCDPREPRPAWLAFYDPAELSGLSGLAHLNLGDGERAEAYAHRALALLRPEFERNRVYYTLALARAQLAQGDVGQGCATASTVMMDGMPMPARTRKSLAKFHTELTRSAPDACEARELMARLREIPTRPKESP